MSLDHRDSYLDMLIDNKEVIKHSLKTFIFVFQVIKVLPEKYLGARDREDLLFAALFHDLGKTTWETKMFDVKKEELSRRDWLYMQTHPLVSAKMLQESLDTRNLKAAISIIQHHHERPGRKGYPFIIEPGLPVLILAACDVIIAATEKREYRSKPFEVTEAICLISFAPEEVIYAITKVCNLSNKECLAVNI